MKRRKIQIHKAHSFEEARRFDIDFWRNAGPQERFSASWLMVKDAMRMSWDRGTEPRLRRSVQDAKRRA